MQAVKTSGSTNLHTVYLTTPNALILKKSQLSKEFKALVQVCMMKAYLHFYLDTEEIIEDELYYYMLVKLVLLSLSGMPFGVNIEHGIATGIICCMMYMTDDEFLYNFRMDRACMHQLKEMVKDDEVFSKCWGKRDKRPVLLIIMVFLKYLGSYGNEASLQKIGRAISISKGDINDCVMQVSQAILKLQKKVIRWPDDK